MFLYLHILSKLNYLFINWIVIFNSYYVIKLNFNQISFKLIILKKD